MLNALRSDNSPFSEQQLGSLNAALATLNAAQTQWLSGYLAGRFGAAGALEFAAAEAVPAARPSQPEPITVLYGSETGNGEKLAIALAGRLEQAGLAADLRSLDGYRPAQLAKLKRAVFIMSTHGEGDPPEEAVDLFEFLDGPRAPRLEQLEYRVLALGDRSYAQFCAAGQRLDQRLQALGARPFGPRVDCDVDYSSQAETWAREVLARVNEWVGDSASEPADATAQGQTSARSSATPRLSVVPSHATASSWTRERPFEAELLQARKITAPTSAKDVYHLELSLAGSGLHYQAGDALGVWAPNDAALVDEVLTGLGLESDTEVSLDGEFLGLAEALTGHRELTRLSSDTINAYAAAAGRADLAQAFAALDSNERQDWIAARQFADLVAQYPGSLAAQALVDALRPLAPRSYSIASSQALVGEEVHLTVATLSSGSAEQPRLGVATGYLNQRLEPGSSVRVFHEPNRRFHLPEDRQAPLILIGAGTGIAPYRAFLQELEAEGSNPDTWLVFGNPSLRTDFLYQREWLQWRSQGLVQRVDGAWSRDQAQKRYVQHVLLEQSARLDAWLRRGAFVYVCGSLAMGAAVQEALVQALASARGLDLADATENVAALRRDKRLRKDLY